MRVKYVYMDEESGGIGGTGGSSDGMDDIESMQAEISNDLFPESSKDDSSEDDDLSGVKVDGEEDADESEGDGKESKDGQDEPKTDGTTGNITTSQAPNTWKKEVATEWGNLPEVVRQEILRREEDVHKGIEGYRTAANLGDTFYNTAKDFVPDIQARGIQPLEMVKSFFEIEKVLARGSNDEKVNVLQRLANEYGIVLDGNGSYTFQDDSVMELKQQLQALTARENERVALSETEKKSKISNEINTFASDPANVHFDTVADDMAVLIRANSSMSLKDAYNKAVWMNDKTRAIEVAKQTESKLKEEEAKNKQDLAKARKLSSVNLGKSKDAGNKKVRGSWEDNLASNYDDIVSRV